MKKWQIVSSLGLCLLVIFLLLGCARPTPIPTPTEDSDYIIRVTGTARLSYAGNYSVTTSDGQITSHSLSGIIPSDNISNSRSVVLGDITINIINMGVEYVVRGISVSCTFQKTGKSWSQLHPGRLPPEPPAPTARTGEEGTLKIEIIKGGKVIASSHTNALWGVVTVATP